MQANHRKRMISFGPSFVFIEIGALIVATWQFDFHVLPGAAVASMYGAVPLRIPRSDFDSGKWWDSTITPTSLETDIATLLPSLESWSKDLHQWGQDDGNRVDVMWQSGSVASILVRVDVRRYSPVFLIGFLDIARKHGWVL